MYTALVILHVIVSLLMIAAILVQSGKGGGLAAGLGGASATQDVFGAVGAQTFLAKATIALGTLFMGISLVLAYLAAEPDSAMDLGKGSSTSQTSAEPVVSEGGSGSGDKQSADAKKDQPQGAKSGTTPGTEKGESAAGDKAESTEGTSAPSSGSDNSKSAGGSNASDSKKDKTRKNNPPENNINP